MGIEISMLRESWDDFKDRVSHKDFKCDEPVLTRHGDMQTSRREFACFESDNSDDIMYIIGILPDFSVITNVFFN